MHRIRVILILSGGADPIVSFLKHFFYQDGPLTRAVFLWSAPLPLRSAGAPPIFLSQARRSVLHRAGDMQADEPKLYPSTLRWLVALSEEATAVA